MNSSIGRVEPIQQKRFDFSVLDGWIVPNEIKSMSEKQFAELTAPKGDHVFQVSMYHDMLENEGFQVHPEAVIIYCTKDFKHGIPYKEFHVDTAKAAVRNMIADAKAVGRQVRSARERGTLPPRIMCAHHSTTKAKACPFVVSCFNMPS